MKWSGMIVAAVAAMILDFGLSGCAPTAGQSWAVTCGSITQRDDGVMYSYGTLRLTHNGRLYLMLTAAQGMGDSYSGGEGTYHGKLQTKDGVQISWSCVTHDGQSGNVTIDNQEYDLSKGALFLVSNNDKPVNIQQLAIGADQIVACSDDKTFLGVMKANPQMASFLRLCKNDK